LYADALELRAEVGPPPRAVPTLEGAALAAVEHGQPATAARLLGKARAIDQRTGVGHADKERSLTESVSARVRVALSDDAFDVAFTAGSRATLPDLVAELRRLGGEPSVGLEPHEDPPVSIAPVMADRELAVLELAANGLPTKTIARMLGLGERTVKVAIAAARSKLGAQNRAHAIVLAAQLGLLALREPGRGAGAGARRTGVRWARSTRAARSASSAVCARPPPPPRIGESARCSFRGNDRSAVEGLAAGPPGPASRPAPAASRPAANSLAADAGDPPGPSFNDRHSAVTAVPVAPGGSPAPSRRTARAAGSEAPRTRGHAEEPVRHP